MAFINLLKALATLLVMNSHCDELLPIPALATGGSVGDSFFFAVSGFALFYSVDKKPLEYLRKRVSRIYPSVIIITIIAMIVSAEIPIYKMICKFNNISFIGAVKSFLFPTNFHFISAIVVFYLLYYLLLHNREGYKSRIIIVAFSLVIVIYAIAYVTYLDTTVWSIESEPFKFLYWFMAFLAGGLFRGYYEKIKCLIKNKKTVFGVCSIVLFILFYVLKIFLSKLHIMHFQFIIQIIELVFLFCFFSWMVGIEDRLTRFSKSKPWKIIDFLGSITLENYLFMDLVIAVYYVNNIPFPYSYILVFFTTFLLSGVVHTIVGYIQKKFT